MNTIRIGIGFILSVLAWAMGGLVVFGAAIYAVGVVAWFHAPVLMVLSLTVPIALVLLGIAWAINRLGKSLRN